MQLSRLSMSLPAAFALVAPPVLAEILVVEEGATMPTAFDSIQEAVDAAVDGDLILVRAGFYEGFAIDGKSLTVVSDANSDLEEVTRVWTDIAISNLSAGQSVTLDGLSVYTFQFNTPAGSLLELEDNAGPVLVQDSVLSTLAGHAGGSTSHGVAIRNCVDVSFVNSLISAAFPVLPGATDGEPGMVVENSSVTIHGSTVSGGLAGFQPLNGGTGIRLIASTLFLSDSDVHGGAGGDGVPEGLFVPCTPATDGGAGLRLEGGSQAYLQGAQTVGGAGGDADVNCDSGADGLAQDVVGGTVTVLDSVGTLLTSNTPVRAGEVLDIAFEGTAGESAWMLVAPTLGVSPFLLDYGGSVVPSLANSFVVALGVIPLGGSLEWNVPIGAAGGSGRELAIQTLSFGTSGFVLSNGRHISLLPAGI